MWVGSLELVYSKSGNFEALDFQNYNCFCKKNKTTARATPGEQVILIISPIIIVILEMKSFKVASCQVKTRKISPGRCDLGLRQGFTLSMFFGDPVDPLIFTWQIRLKVRYSVCLVWINHVIIVRKHFIIVIPIQTIVHSTREIARSHLKPFEYVAVLGLRCLCVAEPWPY